jgi:hypothetical protein
MSLASCELTVEGIVKAMNDYLDDYLDDYPEYDTDPENVYYEYEVNEDDYEYTERVASYA